MKIFGQYNCYLWTDQRKYIKSIALKTYRQMTSHTRIHNSYEKLSQVTKTAYQELQLVTNPLFLTELQIVKS